MAPPDWNAGKRATDPIADANIPADSRLRPNAEKLVQWLDFLLHPEEHEYDRTVIYNDGTKREEPGNVDKYDPSKDIDLRYGATEEDNYYDFESVLEGYQPWQFLHGIAAVATQKVESKDSVLQYGAGALNNIFWVGDERVPSLVDAFQETGWEGDARTAFVTFLMSFTDVANQVNKIADRFHAISVKYAVIIKGTRDNLDAAAADLVKAFDDKFYAKEGSSIDVLGIVLGTVAAAAVTYVTAGGAAAIATAALGQAWSDLFVQGVTKMVTDNDNHGKKRGQISGFFWRELAQSYFHTQAQIMTDAKNAVDSLNAEIQELLQPFESKTAKVEEEESLIPEFLEKYGV